MRPRRGAPADSAENRVYHACRAVDVEAELDHAVDDVLDLLVGGALLHDD